ncbi:glycosyltransferase [Ancylobacter sonchi]|uniref:glycosyltransferase n=1 Tax=Ancylobacter sonchi TaxID=1937790 RepID=UPI001BD6A870|nr:glycosyltransferase family 2 protein [Ancylobacter sonchi]MBS7532525.1 glycosyltransferase [Ancylobacter sonchi]
MTLPRLPLVSFVVVNHNYGRFLPELVNAIRAQSYPEIECILVDDASTDDSIQVITRLIAEDPALRLVALRHNVGQSLASMAGWEAARGAYVAFLDADDLILPDYAATHVYVHMSSRRHVALTSCDMFQALDGRAVVATGEALNGYFAAHGSAGAEWFRPVDVTGGLWPLGLPGDDVLRHVAYVPPSHSRWCWSPTSGNVYRRDALEVLVGMAGLDHLRMTTDVLFCAGTNCISGSLLIDRPLAVYRLHGDNLATVRSQLDNVRVMRAGSECSQQALRLLIAHFLSEAERIVPRFWHAASYVEAVESLGRTLGEGGDPNFLPAAILQYGEALTAAMGQDTLSAWMRRHELIVEAKPEPVLSALSEPSGTPTDSVPYVSTELASLPELPAQPEASEPMALTVASAHPDVSDPAIPSALSTEQKSSVARHENHGVLHRFAEQIRRLVGSRSSYAAKTIEDVVR